MHTHQQSSDPVATIGLDIGKNTFDLVGLDERGPFGSASSLSRCRRAIAPSSARFPSVATSTCASSSCRPLTSSSSGGLPRP